MIRTTTSGTLNTYRYQLQRSTYTLNKSRNTVLSGKQFESFADDPASAARSFQLRRSMLRAESQSETNQNTLQKYNVAWSTLNSVLDDVNQTTTSSAYTAIMSGQSDASASGRNALGQTLNQLAENITQTMNGRYGDNFVFSGADGLTLPFTWETDETGQKTLCYRGISVDTVVPELQMDEETGEAIFFDAEGNIAETEEEQTHYKTADGELISVSDYEQLQKDQIALDYMAKDEKKYADVGLGLEEDENGNVISSSAINTALQGINFLGYGKDEDGDPKNIVSIINRMGDILQNCDVDSGAFASEDEKTEFYRLAEKFEDAAAQLSDKHVELDAEADFLNTNQKQLESLTDTLNEQVTNVEDVDLADAITSLSWAQYCYNAALQCGQSILSQSLMDYLNN